VRAYVAVALLLMLTLSGCSGKKKDADAADDHKDDDAAALDAVLTLSIRAGNQTFNFTSAKATGHAGHAGNATSSGSATTTSAANATVGGNATAGNLTGNVSTPMPSGTAPLNVTFTVSATGVGNATGLLWTLDFGDRGNATAANATAGVSGNGTGNATAAGGNATGQATGTTLPGSANHTYTRAGDFNVTYILRAGNATLGSLKATLHIDAANGTATATPALPAVTHFEYGESLGCTGDFVGITCLDWESGPPGSDIDGHWIALGEAYWGLALTSTVDQIPGALEDSDCVFTDDAKSIVGEANNGGGPCMGTVPDGATWLFIYPYGPGALGMTVDFAPAAE
jgi:hypothetical protein